MPGAVVLDDLLTGTTSTPSTSLKTANMDFWVEHGLFDGLEVRGDDDIVPSKEGMIKRNRVKTKRSIEIMGNLQGLGVDPSAAAIDFINKMQTFEGLFPLDARRWLQAELSDGSTYTIEFLALNLIIDMLTTDFARISVELESITPDWTVT